MRYFAERTSLLIREDREESSPVGKSAGGEGGGAGEAVPLDGVVQGHDGAGEGLEVGNGLGVDQLSVLEVPGLEVHHAGRNMSSEPRHDRA